MMTRENENRRRGNKQICNSEGRDGEWEKNGKQTTGVTNARWVEVKRKVEKSVMRL